MHQSGTKTVLVGWDGATFSVLDTLMSDGTMPFLANFVSAGVKGVLWSTPHPLTPAAWTTLMTGVSPGEHGIFDFVKADPREDRYSYILGTSGDVNAETVWSIAARNGCEVTCLNFPSMFPAPKLSGYIVPGFVPWAYLSRAVHPKSLYQRMQRLPGFEARTLALDWDLERKALQGLPEDQYESWIEFHTLRERHWFDTLHMLMTESPCELTAVLFDGVDKLQHLCYHLLDPIQDHQFRSAWAQKTRNLCRQYFRQLDGFLESIVKLAGDDARVFIASDHGFTSAGSEIFYVNVWLERYGCLRWAEGVPLDQECRLTVEGHAGSDTMFNWAATRAFALTASGNGIYIRQSTDPERGVPPSEYESFRRQIADSLLGFKNSSGENVVQEVMFREDAFPGSRMLDAPDLTLVMRDRSFVSVLRADAPLKPRISPYGTHHPEGIFIASGPGIRTGIHIPDAQIASIAPTLLYSLGLAVPSTMQGRANLAAFEPWFVEANPVGEEEVATKLPCHPAGAMSVEAEQEEAVISRLKALGYME